MSCFDSCGVYLLSIIHPPRNPDCILQTVTPKHDHEKVYVPCHPSQVSYQKHMGGVDLSDQLIKNFSVIRKSRKAWEKPLSYDLKVYLLDSFIIMSKAKPLNQPRSLLIIRWFLKSLVEDYFKESLNNLQPSHSWKEMRRGSVTKGIPWRLHKQGKIVQSVPKRL